nr:hypothetical protein [Tanacetum cinerariifolium]
MKAHCIDLELKYQNQALKSGQHGQILNETSNKAKIKNEINVLETMNIKLEHSVAKLLKENKTLKKHYKELYDFIKITRSKTIEQTTSLLANNADLKAQIQEKVFAIADLRNNLRKLKGNSVNTKLAKTSVLGKLVLQSLKNQSVVRQSNAFKSERPQIESAFVKPNQVIASSESRNSSKNMPRFSLNDMVHNYYLEEARKKTQERNRNSKSSVIRMYDKTSPRSDLRWKPIGRIFKTIGLRWIPTRKLLASCTIKDDSKPTHGSNVDIPNIHECKQTLDFSAENQVVSQSSDVTTADVSDKRQQQPYSTLSTLTLATTVTAEKNFAL